MSGEATAGWLGNSSVLASNRRISPFGCEEKESVKTTFGISFLLSFVTFSKAFLMMLFNVAFRSFNRKLFCVIRNAMETVFGSLYVNVRPFIEHPTLCKVIRFDLPTKSVAINSFVLGH